MRPKSEQYEAVDSVLKEKVEIGASLSENVVEGNIINKEVMDRHGGKERNEVGYILVHFVEKTEVAVVIN